MFSDRRKATMMKLHGIANCDTVKKARAWLDANAIGYEWIDFRKSPPSRATLERWAGAAGWEKLLNRRGTTWRKVPPEQQSAVRDAASAIALMQARPTLIKRPVIETDGEVSVGFDTEDYARRFMKPA